MILFKFFQEFLLPSVFVFVLFLAGLISLKIKKQKIGKFLIVIGILLYYFFSISPTADLILKPLEEKYQLAERLVDTDTIVLLLGNQENSILRAGEVVRLYFQEKQRPKIIISGASALDPEENPAKELKKYLSERGMLAEDIILEDKSRNTFESAKNIKEIIGSESFLLVTSAYHLPRSMEVFQKIGTNPIPAPTDFKIDKEYNLFSFFPNSKNLEKSDLAFHEYFGILFYRLWY